MAVEQLQKFTNNATTTVPGTTNNVTTTITVATGTGALFPSLSGSEFFIATLVNTIALDPGFGQMEIVKVTARSGDVMTVVRGQEGTSGTNFPSGVLFELRPTAQAFNNIYTEVLELETTKAPLASPVFTGNPTAPTPTAGDNDTSIATTAFVTGGLTSRIGDTGAASLRNKIINGNFDEWIRGTSLAAAVQNAYLSDRWSNNSGGSTIAVSRQGFTLGQTDVPNNPAFFHRSVVASVAGAGNFAQLQHKIEGVQTLSGTTGILGFWAKADATKNIAVEFYQFFGTGGSPSAAVTNLGTATKQLTTSWQYFTVPVTLPSIAGKTLGSNNDHFLGLAFWLDAGSTFNSRTNSLGQQSGTFDFAQIQFEQGSTASPFEVWPLQLNKNLCERYARRVGVTVGQAFSGTTASSWYYAGTSMRAVPTGSTFSGWTISTAGGGNAGGTVAMGVTHNSDLSDFRFDVSGAAGLVAGNASVFTPPAGFYLSAEL